MVEDKCLGFIVSERKKGVVKGGKIVDTQEDVYMFGFNKG